MDRQPANSRKPRRPGRPRRSGGRRSAQPDQRQALLDAAVALFARQGIAATSLQAVARSAGVTPALLHYYFGSRERLLDAVVAERLLPLLAGVLQEVAAGGGFADPRALVRALVPVVMRTVTAHTWLPPLWVREILTDGGLLRERMLLHARQFAPLLRDRFVAAKNAGRIRPDIEPRLLLVSLIGLTLFPFAAAPIWRPLLDAGDITADAMAAHTLALLDHGVFIHAGGS